MGKGCDLLFNTVETVFMYIDKLTLHVDACSAFHFIEEQTPMDKVFNFAGSPNYCPVIVGSIRACIKSKI